MTKTNEYILPKEKPFETVYELKDEIENKKPVEEAKHVEEVVRLPMLSEITDKDGKVKLPPEFIDKLRDPNARFRLDLMVFPVGIEDWEVLKAACMSRGCNDTELGYWRHGNCSYSYPDRIQWSTWARLKCPSCYKIADISEWRFICHGSGCTETTTGITKLSDAMIMILEDKSVSQEFVALFLRNAREMFKNK